MSKQQGLKLYHVKTQADYDALMQELEDQGCRWNSGEKPTETNVFNEYESETVVENDMSVLSFDSKRWFEDYSDTTIIEYTAKEKEMKKDKEWLKNEVSSLPFSEKGVYKGISMVEVVKLINQLEEPTWGDKMLSQAVYDSREKLKKSIYLSPDSRRIVDNIFKEMYDEIEEPEITEEQAWNKIAEYYPENRIALKNGFECWYYNQDKENQETFARAVLDGYEVEKEKLYRVFDKRERILIGKESNDSEVEIFMPYKGWVTKLTEKEIKDYDERYWAFRQEVKE